MRDAPVNWTSATIENAPCSCPSPISYLKHQERAIIVARASLTARDKERYRRSISVEGFGEKGQLRLERSTVGIVGLGGLGSPATMYLAAAGVGGLILADDQAVELSNLNRQLLHWENDVTASKSKVESASWKLMEMRSDLRIEGRKGSMRRTWWT